MQASYHVDDRAIPWVFTIYVLFNLVGTPLMAKLSDLFGRRSVYVTDVSLFAVGSLLVVFAPSFGVVLAGRAIQGLGAGGIFPVASAVIGDTFPPEKRGSALGLIGAVFGLAFVIGPIIGGVLLAFSWHWLFLINLPIAAGLIIASLRLLPATRPATRKPLDLAGIGRTGCPAGNRHLRGEPRGRPAPARQLTSSDVVPIVRRARCCSLLFVFTERRAADPSSGCRCSPPPGVTGPGICGGRGARRSGDRVRAQAPYRRPSTSPN